MAATTTITKNITTTITKNMTKNMETTITKVYSYRCDYKYCYISYCLLSKNFICTLSLKK